MFLRRKKVSRTTGVAFALDELPRVGPGAPYSGRGGSFFKDIYDADHVETRQSGRFRWLLSSCLAAAVGAVAILVVVFGSSESDSIHDGLMPAFKRFREGSFAQNTGPTPKNSDGLKWMVAKSDRLQLTSGALSTRYIIHESSKSRRDGREYVRQKPYARIVARMAPVTSTDAEKIPPFNPFRLYGTAKPASTNSDLDESAGSGLSRTDVSVKVVELLGGILPGEDGQELDAQEVQELVEKSADAPAGHGSDAINGSGDPLDAVADDTLSGPAGGQASQAWSPKSATSDQSSTTEIYKSPEAAEDSADALEGSEVSLVTVGNNDSLTKILTKAGAEPWQARAMIEAAHGMFPETALLSGQDVRITVVPSLTQPDKKEPVRFSVFSDGHDHLVTVMRSAAGEYVASAQPLTAEEIRQGNTNGESSANSTLYASVYNAGLAQHLQPETILQVLRVNAFDTDFRRRVRPGDTLEMFFDMKDDQSIDGPPGDLLYAAISSGGLTYKFFRFRSADGSVDFYDPDGNTSRKFLVRKPVRAEDARLTSGYGVRYHPLLNSRKMHTGVDWATDQGTPIFAAGNGTIDEVGRKGYYGNYIRIRHANGYQTAYGHMHHFAEGMEPGVKVRQGQVIGFVGSTGLSSGPHVHFEVLVNNQFVDPMTIDPGREKKLQGADLQNFQKERGRIEELLRRAPVMTANK